jgi:uncharacterized protein YpmB
MNTILAIIFGAVIYVILMAVLLAVMRLEKTPQEDDDEQLKAVSKPAALRPHVRANTAYGEPLQ